MLRNLGQTSLKASYGIWLARDNENWKPDPIEWEPLQKAAFCVPKPPKVHLPSDKLPSVKIATDSRKTEQRNISKANLSFNSTPPPKKQTKYKPVPRIPLGIQNMGNSCYANATLQALFVLPEIWKPIPSDHVAQVPLLRAFFATMLSINTGKGVIRPNQFLSQLGSYISKTRRVPFRVNAQQDVCEVLGYILQELISSPNMSPEILTTRLTKTVTCNSCVEPSTSEEAYIMLSTDMATSVATSIKKFMEGEFLSFTCIATSCNSTDGLRENVFTSLPEVLIIQVKRFAFKDNAARRVDGKIACDEWLALPINTETGNQIVDYQLTAVIHHSGSLSSGHYTATVVDRASHKMYHCNDSSITESHRIDQKAAYVLFYVRLRN